MSAFDQWWESNRRELTRELDDHGLAVREVAMRAWNDAVDDAATLAFDMPLHNSKHNRYRWSDTGKAVSWDIAHAIRKLISIDTHDAAPSVSTEEKK